MADETIDVAKITAVLKAAAIRRIMPKFLKRVKEEAPVYNGPDEDTIRGELRDSLYAQYRESNRGQNAGFDILIKSDSADTSDIPLAAFVIHGTKSHPITVRSARFLVFTTQDGEIHFKKEVHHPGTTANPFGERAAREMDGIIKDELQQALAPAISDEVRTLIEENLK